MARTMLGLILSLVAGLAGCVERSYNEEAPRKKAKKKAASGEGSGASLEAGNKRRGGKHAPSDLTNKFQTSAPGVSFALWESFNGFTDFDHNELTSEDGIGGIKADLGNAGNTILALVTLSSGEEVVKIMTDNGYIYVGYRNVWGRVDNQAFTPFGVQGYRVTGKRLYGGDYAYTVMVYLGDDGMGNRDSVIGVNCDGKRVQAPLRSLYRARAEGIIKRAEKRGYYKGVQDSEGYIYVVSLQVCDMHRALIWDPFLFEPGSVQEWRQPRFDVTTLRPLAALSFEWEKVGTHGNAVDFARLRDQVYGAQGSPDILQVGFRKEKAGWRDGYGLYLAGGNVQTEFRKSQEHMVRARKLSESYSDEDKAQATAEYTQALKYDSTCAEAYYGRAFAASSGFNEWRFQSINAQDLKRLIADLTTAMELDAKYRTELANKGLALGKAAQQDFAGAEGAYSEAIRLNPKNAELFRARQKIREKLDKTEASREDEMEATRIETEAKREEERKKEAAIRKAEEERREAPDRILVDAGISQWSHETATYAQFIPPYDKKLEILQKRLKDVNEKPVIIQLVGDKAEGGGYYFEQFGFKLLKGKKVDSEEKISLIIESTIDSSATIKTGQGRTLQDVSGKEAMTCAFKHLQVLYTKGKLDWQSEKYSELASYWEKLAQKSKEKDDAAVLEALEEILRLDPEDKGALKLKLDNLEAKKDWKAFEAECTRQLSANANDLDLRQRRLNAYEQLKNVEGQIDDLGFLTGKTTNDWNRQTWLTQRANLLADLGRYREAVETWTKLIDKSPDNPNLYYSRAECEDKAGDSYGGQRSRARGVEISRLYSKLLPFVLTGVATWQDQKAEVTIRPELQARLNLTLQRFADPEEAPVQVFVSGGSVAGTLEKAGFAVRVDEPGTCDVSIKVEKGDATITVRGGSPMTLARVDGEKVLNALSAYAILDKIKVFSPAYLKLAEYEERRLAAARVGDSDTAKEIKLAIALEFSSKWAFVADYLDSVRWNPSGNEERILGITTEILKREVAWRDAYRKVYASSYGVIKDPYAGALELQIRAHQSLGMHAEVLADYDKLLEVNPTDRVSTLNSKAAYLKEAGEYRAAAETKTRVAALQSKELDGGSKSSYLIETYFELADLWKAAGDEPASRDALRRAAGVALTEPGYIIQRAEKRADRSDFGGAMADANEALSKVHQKTDGSLYFRRGAIRLKRGDAQGALDDYTQGLKLGPTEDAYNARAGILEKLGRTDEARSDRAAAWRLPLGDYAWYYSSRAGRRLNMGDKDGAFEDYQKAIDLTRGADDRAGYIAERAEARARLGDYEVALKDFEAAVKECRSDKVRVRILDKRIALRFQRKDFAGALSDLGETIRMEETWGRLLQRARAQLALGKKDLASDDVRWVLSLNLPTGDLDSVARELKGMGETKAALEVYAHVLETATEPFTRIDALRRRAKFKMGYLSDYAGAVADLDQALQAGPTKAARAGCLEDRFSAHSYLQDKRAMLADLDALLAEEETWNRLLRRAKLRRELGEKEKAGEDVGKARTKNWCLAECDSLTQAFLEAGNEKAALEVHDKAVDRVTSPGGRASRLAKRAQFKWAVLDDFAGGLADMDKAVQLLPSSAARAPYLEQRAGMKLAKSDLAGALEDLNEAVRLEETVARLIQRAKLEYLKDDKPAVDEDVAKIKAAPLKSYYYWDVDWRANGLLAVGETAATLELYDKVLAFAPADSYRSALLERKAQVLLAKGDVSAAIENLDRAMQVDSGNRAGYLQTRLSFHRAVGDLAAAVQDVDELLKIEETWNRLLDRARLHQALGHKDEASADVRKVLSMKWDSNQISTLATGLWRAGAGKAAIEVFDQALKHSPQTKRPELLLSRAGLRGRMGDVEGAEKDCDEAIKLRDDPWARHTRAQVRLSRGNADGARADLEAWTTLGPIPDFNRALFRRDMGDAEGARRELDEAVAWSRADYSLHARRAEFLFESGDLEGALKAAERALAGYSSEATALRVRTLVLASKGDKAFARSEATSHASLAGAILRAEIFLLLGETDEAVRCAKMNANANADDVNGWLLLARAHLAKGDRASALAAVNKAIELRPLGFRLRQAEELRKKCE